MQARHLLIGGLGVLTAAAALSANFALRSFNLRGGAATVAGSRQLYAFGSRSTAQLASPTLRKLDAALAELERHAPAARPDHTLADLRAMNPAARFRQTAAGAAPEILIDAVTRGDPQQLKAALVALGLEHPAVFSNDVGGWLPVNQIDAAAARDEVLSMRASMPHRRAAVATQGDFAQRSDVVRSTYPSLTGSGITVGVLSDSFDCYSVYAQSSNDVPASGNEGYAYNGFTATYADDQASGALAAGVKVLEEADCLQYGQPQQSPYTDEGRAMMQVLHVVAPDASLAFYTGDSSEADFASGITTLAAATSAGGAGANIIADDLGYFDEPFYQDGIVAQAIDTVETNGVAYFSAAGNDANASYENTAPVFGPGPAAGSGLPNAGEKLLNFDPSGDTTTTGLQITIAPQAPGEFLAVVVEWDQPYVTGAPASGGATSQIDVCVTGKAAALAEFQLITNYDGEPTTCTGVNATGTDPYQVLVIGNPANTTITTNDSDTVQEMLNIQVGLANGTPAPGRVIVSVETDGQTSPEPISSPFATNSETIQGHPSAAGAAAVAAAFYFDTPRCLTTPAQLEPYSSLGGAPILFDSSGTRLATPILRQKPNFTGPDGVNNTFLGFTLASGGITVNTSIAQCQNITNYPNFFGTSAATPHAAGIAALMLQANSALTPTQIYTALETSALPIGTVPTTGANPTYNFNAGYGFIQADAALAAVPPGPPTLSFSLPSVAVGTATTLSWSSTNAASCTASGSWSGAQTTSGTRSITPTAIGTDAYSMTCTNSVGTSTAATANLTVIAAAAPSSGGGGALDEITLLALAGLGLALRRRASA